MSVAGFSDVAADEVVAALTQHVAAGQKKLILDLRGNPGGYVTAARKIASQFIGSGVVFWEQDAAGNQVATDALSGGVATNPAIRLVVLIDGGSASASEIVAGALQDTGRATLIGAQSYGKGTVQQWQQLTGDGGAFRLTVARWLTPNKRWIHKVGLTPDVVVALPKSLPIGSDPILDKALEVLARVRLGDGRGVAAGRLRGAGASLARRPCVARLMLDLRRSVGGPSRLMPIVGIRTDGGRRGPDNAPGRWTAPRRGTAPGRGPSS